MSFDTAYEAITEHNDVSRWAYGTGFVDPLDGVDTTVPAGIDPEDLEAYCLMLGDDALVLSQRLAEWVTCAPELEIEVALANIALDLLGQARLLLTRAAHAEGAGRSEDDLAYLRTAREFRNVQFVERPNGDFAECVARLLFFSTWRLALLVRMRGSADPVLAALAHKAVSEVSYHRDFAAEWVVRLGDGTEESHRRMQRAVDEMWPSLAELFVAPRVEARLEAVAADSAAVRAEFDDVIDQVLSAATLTRPAEAAERHLAASPGRQGDHTQALTELLTTMQVLARQDREAAW